MKNNTINNYIKNIFIVFILWIGLVSAGPLEYGLRAFQQGDYATAFRVWGPLADQGHAIAQYNLGVMYYEGFGIASDYAEAAKWFRKSADQGNDDAQRNLGVLYYEGNGVPQDDIQAYMWFDIASIHGNQEGMHNRDMVAKRMTFTQVTEAQRLARGWKPVRNRLGRR